MIAITLGFCSGGNKFISRAKSSISQMMGILYFRALIAVQWGFGRLSGMPGDKIRASKIDQSTLAKLSTFTPLSRAKITEASLSSQAKTSAPPEANDNAALIPVSPKPKTATFLPLYEVDLITSLPKLQS